jgi:hypothetical protein
MAPAALDRRLHRRGHDIRHAGARRKARSPSGSGPGWCRARGRCTRGPADWAMVVVLGSELTKYLLRPETQQALDPELQAEIQFGVENSRSERPADILDNIETFLDQADNWRTEAEPYLAEYRREATRVLRTGPRPSRRRPGRRSRPAGWQPPAGGQRPAGPRRTQHVSSARARTPPAATGRYGCSSPAPGRTKSATTRATPACAGLQEPCGVPELCRSPSNGYVAISRPG